MRRLIFPTLLGALLVSPSFVSADQVQPREQTGTTGTNVDEELADARHDLMEAAQVVREMNQQAEVKNMLQRAKGVFLVPDYGRAAYGVGAAGGEGVLLVRTNGGWSDPVFYNLGSISVGVQAGVSAGQIGFLLMTDRAVNSFKGQNTFSLNANAGLTIVNWSARSQASLGKADVVLWSDTEGAFAGVSLSASDISADTSANQAYYGRHDVNPGAIMSGQITRRSDESDALKKLL